jgi:hypothetical protein
MKRFLHEVALVRDLVKEAFHVLFPHKSKTTYALYPWIK